MLLVTTLHSYNVEYTLLEGFLVPRIPSVVVNKHHWCIGGLLATAPSMMFIETINAALNYIVGTIRPYRPYYQM